LKSYNKYINESNKYIIDTTVNLKSDKDIQVQVPGYGILTFEQIKNKVKGYLMSMSTDAAKGNFDTAINTIVHNNTGILIIMLKTIEGVNSELEGIRKRGGRPRK